MTIANLIKSTVTGLALVIFSTGSSLGDSGDYTLFESGHVRPMAISPDQRTLYAVNTPDNRLEVFRIDARSGHLQHIGSVPVGLEPVAVAVRNEREVWVVNHLSDSVSIIDTTRLSEIRVVKTLLVGDEPRDIVFANRRAFITTAHRGQNVPYNPQFTTPGIGRADVWIFDANNLGEEMGGDPINIIQLFTDTPRALAVSKNQRFVYAAGFLTGNRTTSINALSIDPTDTRLAALRVEGVEDQPHVGVIVKFQDGHWKDVVGQVWDDKVKLNLPDRDVFVIDASLPVPALRKRGVNTYSGVGTVLFNMIENPVNGNLYVSNTDGDSLPRFEGPLMAPTSVQGRLHESRITVLTRNGSVQPVDLNSHIDYSTCCIPNSAEAEKSLAFPMEMAISNNGGTLYVVAFGSNKIGIFNTKELDNNQYDPNKKQRHIALQGDKSRGPSGLVLNEAFQKLYVMTRFDNSISVINTANDQEVQTVSMYSPEPDSIVEGRRFLYDAKLTSSHGDSACASCHVFGDFDGIAWDLGNPNESTVLNPGPFMVGEAINNEGELVEVSFLPSTLGFSFFTKDDFSPLKGPMTTQSLRGMDNHGPMHWRGDRRSFTASAQPHDGVFDEEAAFKAFNGAFVDLVGRHAPLDDEQMQAFTDFILQITYPPNPVRNLDNSLTIDQQAGEDFYFDRVSDSFASCNGCHVLDPTANSDDPSVAKPGFFGTDGRYTFEVETQVFKIPHLRNMYQKIGMFGMAANPVFALPGIHEHQGDQIRGFGFLHDGSTDTMFNFFHAIAFSQRPKNTSEPLITALGFDPGNPDGFDTGFTAEGIPFITDEGKAQIRQMEQFMLAFDSNMKPIVGQQITLNQTPSKAVMGRVKLLMARADAGDCELVARRKSNQGFLYTGNRMFQPSTKDSGQIKFSELEALAKKRHGEITFTCVPPGSGRRIALDRDSDTLTNADSTL